MKKLIFIIILFFNLIPVLKKGEIRFSGPEAALADMFGGELDEVIVTPDYPEPDEPDIPITVPEDYFPEPEPEQMPEDPDDMYIPEEETSASSKNDITDPCLKGLVDNVINGNTTNPFSNILKTAFGASSEKELIFSQYNGINETNTDGRTGGSQYNLEIKLNLAALDYSSNENVTATIYHEIIHSYLFTQGIVNDVEQHNIIANEWRDIISSQLQTDYANLSQTDADALAWGGLNDSTLWQQMYQNDQTNNTGVTGNIAQINQNYKNLNNQNNGSNGTHCN